jgi:hypothetical protein
VRGLEKDKGRKKPQGLCVLGREMRRAGFNLIS